MYIYVDESGVPSLKYGTGQFFVVGCLLVYDPRILEAFVYNFKKQRGWSVREEIKFSDSSPKVRREFLHELREQDIQACCLIVEKSAIATREKEIRPGFYQYAVSTALDRALVDVECKHVVLDNYLNAKPKNRDFISYLRQVINQPVRRVGDFSIGDSQRRAGLQAADMMVGSVAHEYERGDSAYSTIFASVLTRHYWPEKNSL